MLCHSKSDILLRYMFPVAEKKEDDSWQRNPGGVWMASQDKVLLHQKFMTFDSHGNGHPIFLTGD